MALAIAGLALGAAAPAYADSAGTEVVTTGSETQQSPLAGGDEEFRELFSSWKALDNPGQPAPGIVTQPHTGVAVPSRMPLGQASLTSGYGMRRHPVLGGRRKHNGIDLAAPTGTPVYATADGTVSRANWFSSYGKYISIEHGGELQTRYAHLSRIAVSDGQRVRKGDVIGYVGSTGRSTGPHLHYEVRVSGRAVDPRPYLDDTARLAALPGGARGGQ